MANVVLIYSRTNSKQTFDSKHEKREDEPFDKTVTKVTTVPNIDETYTKPNQALDSKQEKNENEPFDKIANTVTTLAIVPYIDETHSKVIPSLKPKQKKKLNTFFDKIVTNVRIDFTNKEIQDIQKAIHEMSERIIASVNTQGIFSVARSMADRTAVWKFDKKRGEHFLEFDFLAVLEYSVEHYSCSEEQNDSCPGCIDLEIVPAKLERLRKCYIIDRAYDDVEDRFVFNQLFFHEINLCLASFCHCFSVTSDKFTYAITFQSTPSEHEHGCDRCTISMPTGALSMNTYGSTDPSACSMILIWTSKAKRLSAPDKFLLHEPQQITRFPIYVDFLPALESRKTKASGDGYEHDYFIVPKHCNADA